MIKAVLLDLDDTLLKSNMERFLPVYLQRLSSKLAEHGDPEGIIANLYRSTERMLRNLDPTRTLKEAFDGHFYPSLGTSQADVRQEIDEFYLEVFPQLQDLTTPIPGATAFIQELVDQGFDIVIATNPLFPRTAIAQRLSWAGIDPDGDQLQLITSYETFHFAKPNPAYYAEILGWLGVPAEAAVMVGNDPYNDLEPAQALGMATLKVSHNAEDSNDGSEFEAARRWIDDMAQRKAAEAPVSAQALLARLRGDLAALHQRANELTGESWRARPNKRDWSALEILCHLRDTEREVNYPRLHTLLTEEAPFLSAANPDDWAQERNYQAQDPAEALARFSAARQQTIARLAEIEGELWQKPARHALLGPTTLGEVMRVAADHNLLHLKQLRTTLSAIH